MRTIRDLKTITNNSSDFADENFDFIANIADHRYSREKDDNRLLPAFYDSLNAMSIEMRSIFKIVLYLLLRLRERGIGIFSETNEYISKRNFTKTY